MPYSAVSVSISTAVDSVCGYPEDFETCPEDCPSGGYDSLCDGVSDDICDPECEADDDPDCEEEGAAAEGEEGAPSAMPGSIVMIGIVIIVLLVLIVIILLVKKR